MESLSKDQALKALQKVVLRKMISQQEMLICELIDRDRLPVEWGEAEFKTILIKMLNNSIRFGNSSSEELSKFRQTALNKKVELLLPEVI